MSYSEDDYLDDSYDYTEPDEDWEDEDDLQPSDSASASNGHAPIAHRGARRAHRVVPQYRHHQQSPQGHQPQAPPSMDPNEEWGGHYGRAQSVYYPQGQTAHAPYIAGQAARGHHGYHQQQGNQHVGPYMGGYPNGNQMVPFANYGPNNPFSQHMGNSSNGNNYFSNEGRPMYDMMQYQHNGYYGNPQHFGVPAHMQQFQMVPAPPVPAPTEHPGQSVTPAPKEPPAPPPDLDKIRLEAEVAALKKHQDEVKAAEKQREVEAQIRKDAEINFQRRMEDMRKAQEEAQKEIEKAKLEAERTARERIEAERKAEEERQKAHSAAMQRAEESARMKFEAELKAAEERRKRGEEDRQRAEEKARLRFEAEMRAAEERRRKEDEDRQRAEESARIRLEAAIKAEAAAKAAAEQKAAEEVARLKQIEEDAKKKAEADAAAKAEKEKADALAQAEAEAAAKKAADELKKKIQEEAKADALAQAEAAAAAKKEAEELKKIIQEEAKVKFEEAAKKKADKAPIKFKDAVGRKFSFPFHLCATWQVSVPQRRAGSSICFTDMSMVCDYREWKSLSSKPSCRLTSLDRTFKRGTTT